MPSKPGVFRELCGARKRIGQGIEIFVSDDRYLAVARSDGFKRQASRCEKRMGRYAVFGESAGMRQLCDDRRVRDFFHIRNKDFIGVRVFLRNHDLMIGGAGFRQDGDRLRPNERRARAGKAQIPSSGKRRRRAVRLSVKALHRVYGEGILKRDMPPARAQLFFRRERGKVGGKGNVQSVVLDIQAKLVRRGKGKGIGVFFLICIHD